LLECYIIARRATISARRRYQTVRKNIASAGKSHG